MKETNLSNHVKRMIQGLDNDDFQEIQIYTIYNGVYNVINKKTLITINAVTTKEELIKIFKRITKWKHIRLHYNHEGATHHDFYKGGDY